MRPLCIMQITNSNKPCTFLLPWQLGEALQISMEMSRLDQLEPLANKHEASQPQSSIKDSWCVSSLDSVAQVLVVANLAKEGGASRPSVEAFRVRRSWPWQS